MGFLLQLVNGAIQGIKGAAKSAIPYFDGSKWAVKEAGTPGKYLGIDSGGDLDWSTPESGFIVSNDEPVGAAEDVLWLNPDEPGAFFATTDSLTEGTAHKYFTTERVRGTPLAGLSLAESGVITEETEILDAFGKLQAQITRVFNRQLAGLATADVSVIDEETELLDALGKLQAQITRVFYLKWSQQFLIVNPASGYVSPLFRIVRDGTGDNFYFDLQGSVASDTTINFFRGSGLLTLASDLASTSATSLELSGALVFTGTPLALLDANGVPEVVQMTAGSGTNIITIVRGQGGTPATAHLAGAILLPIQDGSVTIENLAPVTWSASGVTCTEDELVAYNVAGSGLASASILATQKWRNR